MSAPVLPVEFHTSRKRMLFLLAGSGAFVAAAALMFRDTPNDPLEHMIALFGILFFGCGLVLGIAGLVRPMFLFAFTPQGIELKKGETAVAWRDVAEVRIIEIYRQKMVCVVLKDLNAYLDKQKGYARSANEMAARLAGTPITLNAKAIGMTAEELREMVEEIRRERAG